MGDQPLASVRLLLSSSGLGLERRKPLTQGDKELLHSQELTSNLRAKVMSSLLGPLCCSVPCSVRMQEWLYLGCLSHPLSG